MSLWRWSVADVPVPNVDGVSTMSPEALPILKLEKCLYYIYHSEIPSASSSNRSLIFSPMFRIILSIKREFLFVSEWPYQYAKGKRALAANDIGAVVAAVPRGFADDAVGIGP